MANPPKKRGRKNKIPDELFVILHAAYKYCVEHNLWLHPGSVTEDYIHTLLSKTQLSDVPLDLIQYFVRKFNNLSLARIQQSDQSQEYRDEVERIYKEIAAANDAAVTES